MKRVVLRLTAAALACAAGGCTSKQFRGSGEGEAGDGGVRVPGNRDRPAETPDAGGVVDPGGFDVPFAPGAGGGDIDSNGVRVDERGALVLDPNASASIQPFIWISNSAEGTVSKLRTDAPAGTNAEVARYVSGPGGNADPSRTTVGLNGDVIVANRTGSSVTRIHADIETCPDRNGNGAIETARGPGRENMLNWGEDECVLWNWPTSDAAGNFLGGALRAAAFDFSVGADGELSSAAWIGNYDRLEVYKLDAGSGTLLATVNVGVRPYGAAIDGDGNVWIQGSGEALVRINGETLEVQRIEYPAGAYGITVDAMGRVWVAQYGPHVSRYVPATGAWAVQAILAGSGGRGVAADQDGTIWVADTGWGVHRIEPEGIAIRSEIPIGGGDIVGMAIDLAGKAWAVDRARSQAYRIDPETCVDGGGCSYDTFPVGSGPYTYSDMTGFQLENAAPPIGLYRAIVDGCGGDQQWRRLVWDADVPAGTWLRIRVRVAASRVALGNAQWTVVAEVPDDVPPVDLVAALANTGSIGAVMQIEVSLGAARPELTPVLRDLRLHATCGGDLQ